MREIKFKGKTKYGSWVFGYYFVQIDEEGEPCHKIIENYSDTNRHNPGMKLKYHTVIPETVGQYIGLKDKNGKEIFGEDIVKRLNWDNEYEIGVVEYDKPSFIIDRNFSINEDKNIEFIEGMYQYFENCNIKIIGNKYEDPELLKNEQS